ncbi:hypothetical protein ACGFX4_14360 [Kitasatospora sp. NPDC048365]|uniref:hypothetical protein n=1 Tax=Kitasatospora sp. NPDC048365 TaxID=3364050 RepID=UPI00371FF2C6
MSDHGGAPPHHHRPEDSWWHAVYAGPADTLPDTPDTATDTATVDDWFDSAAGLIGPPRTETPPAKPARTDPRFALTQPAPAPAPPPPAPAPAPAPAPLPPPAVPAQGAPPAAAPAAPAHPHRSPTPPPAEPDAHPGPGAEPWPAVTGPTVTGPAGPAPAAPGVAEPPAPAEPVCTEREPAVPVDGSLPVDPVAPVAEPVPAGALAAGRRARVEGALPHVGERPPTYAPEPTALPAADPDVLAAVVPDTVVDGAQYGGTVLRAASVRGDSARFRGEPRRDALLTVRFGSGEDGLLLCVLASPAREADAQWGAGAAAEAARQLAGAVGRSRAELAADLRTGARDRLRYGLQRLAVQAALPLRRGDALDDRPEEQPDVPGGEHGSLHCVLVSLDPAASHRAAFGTGPGGLYLLRSGHWIDAYGARLLHHPDGEPVLAAQAVPGPRPFRFRLVPATPGDILLLCTPGLAVPIADEPAVAHFLSSHWAHPHPPGTVDFLRQVQVRAKGYADDRTAVALWTE